VSDDSLDEADFAKLLIMFTQTLSEEDEVVLLSDSSADKPPDVLLRRDESRDLKDPQSLAEAEASPYWQQWYGAIHEEKESLHAMKVFEEVEGLPPGRKAIGSRFVFKVKRDENGHVVCFKARLVAQGYTQVPGQDFNHTFAPVAWWDFIRFLLSVAAICDWELCHLDIKTAFLNRELEEELYLRKPKIFGEGYWRLKKGLYGLRQSGRQWYITMHGMYKSIEFKRTEANWCVHYRQKSDTSATATTVDDVLLGASSVAEADHVTDQIGSRFKITNNGDVKWFLGCRVRRWRDRRTLMLDQEQYVKSILHDFDMESANPANAPCNPNIRLTSDMCPNTDEQRQLTQKRPYPALVGKLLYLANCTRPDIAYAVRELARFMGNWGEQHWSAAKHVLRYLKGTKGQKTWLGLFET
jgi:hypothetical protein